LKTAFKTNNSPEYNVENKMQSTHKRDEYLASSLHQLCIPNAIRNIFATLADSSPKDLKNTYPPLKTIVTIQNLCSTSGIMAILLARLMMICMFFTSIVRAVTWT
jgi:hypothetical protein